MNEDSFPSDHAACTARTISRHQKTVSHSLIYRRQQAHYLLNSCCCTLSFNDICYFNSTPQSFLFNFSRERDGEQGTIPAFCIRILTSVSSDCGSDALFRLCFLRFVFFPSANQNWSFKRLSWYFCLSILILQRQNH